MEKTKIKNFAVAARDSLIGSIKRAMFNYGVTEEGIQEKLPSSTREIEYYVNDERFALIGSKIKWRQKLVQELTDRQQKEDYLDAYNDLVEEVAYTWFNRIIAIRFMEVNNYLPSRVRVLSSEEGSVEPDIMKYALDLEDDLGKFTPEELAIIQRKRDTESQVDSDAMYEMLFIKQADALGEILPHLFEKTTDYMKLLFTARYNAGIIKDLITTIPESYFDVSAEGQVEIIGWLYQYYNTVPKDEVMSLPKSVKYRDTQLARATQIFTPDWIVQYMVQNSVGKYWINVLKQRNPDKTESELVQEFNWQYYMVDAQQDEHVVLQLHDVNQTLSEVKIEDVCVIDPAIGSGHILVYIFDLLMDIYESEGYSRSNAAQSIIENNLYGLDIDTRAFQLGYFAVMMKYRQYNRRAFRKQTPVNVYDIPSSLELESFLPSIKSTFSTIEAKNIIKLIEVFYAGNDIGSLLSVKDIDLIEIESLMADPRVQESFELQYVFERLQIMIDVTKVLQQKYDVVVANPPYMGSARMNPVLSTFAKKSFPRSKSDLFSMFIEYWNEMLVPGGYNAMVTMQSWMFLSSFEKMRIHLLNNYTISNLMHMENNVMGIAFGTAVGIFRNMYIPEFNGTYHQIKTADAVGKAPSSLPIPGNRFNRTNQANFEKIPGSIIGFWINQTIIEAFSSESVDKYYDVKAGISSGNNNLFIYQWFEVNNKHFSPFTDSNAIFVPHNKGGDFKRWYGNRNYAIKYNHISLKMMMKQKGFRHDGKEYYFRTHVGWSKITSGKPSFRLYSSLFTFDSAGLSIFDKYDNGYYYLLGLLNTKVANYIFDMLNPTLNLTPRSVKIMPYLQCDSAKKRVYALSKCCVDLVSSSENAFEESWEFKNHPLIQNIAEHERNWTLEEAYNVWEKEALNRFNQLKANEEELNRIFIELYGLQDELTPEEEDKDVSVRKADKERDIKSFLSYFIGCVFGRYSLDVDGLAFAGGEWDDSKYQTFKPNKDNVILLTEESYYNDERDIINRLREFLTVTFGADNVNENMRFIASVLNEKALNSGTSSEQIIRNYFVDKFYKEHVKTYQKRPIYWEMSSGRRGGFKALIYLHRYQADDFAVIRSNYLHSLQTTYAAITENLKKEVIDASGQLMRDMKKQIQNLEVKSGEIVQYDNDLQYIADQKIELDLDDGVVVNHKKVQGEKKLLSPIK